MTVSKGTATDMGKMSRDKGARGELEVLRMYQAAGFTGTRGFMSGGMGGGDLAGDMPDLPEVKFAETVKLYTWVDQAVAAAASGVAGTVASECIRWVLWHRKSRRKWLVTIDGERYIELLVTERECGKR